VSRGGLQRLHPDVLLSGGGTAVPAGVITSGGRRQVARGEATIKDRLRTQWQLRLRDIIMRCAFWPLIGRCAFAAFFTLGRHV